MPPEFVASYWTLAGDVDVFSGLPSPLLFEARVTAAAAAGYTGFGLTFVELPGLVSRLGYEGIRAVFQKHGMRTIELEGLWNWFASGPERESSDVVRKELLRAAEELGARHLKVGGGRTDLGQGTAEIGDAFGQLCAEAAVAGTAVMLEMLPFGRINSLAEAAAVVTYADAPNGGVLLDAWHVTRTATSLLDISNLPPGTLGFVELTDGGPPVGDPIEDTASNRLPCGEGSFDLVGLCAAAAAAGFDGPYGVEVISRRLRSLPSKEWAARTYAAARTVVEASV